MPDEIILTKALRIATTYRCPLNCPVCYAGHSDVDMDEDTFRFFIEEGMKLDFESIAFGGGEPLVNKDQIKEFLGIAKERGYDNAVTTSGVNLTPEYLDELVKCGLDHLQLSIGYNRQNFPDKMKLLDGTKKVQWGINFLVDPRKIPDLPAIHKALEQTDCEYIVYIVPRVGDELQHLRFTYNQVIAYVMILSKIQQLSKKLFFVGCATNFLRNQVCLGLEKGVSISADGKISMCGYCDRWVKVNGSLKDAINEFNENQFTGKCEILRQFIR